MTWEEVLGFEDIIVDIAAEWASRVHDGSLFDDIRQHLYLSLYEKVDLSRANKDVRVYVKAACWKIAEKFCSSRSHGVSSFLSLDSLLETSQVDEERNLRPLRGRGQFIVEGE